MFGNGKSLGESTRCKLRMGIPSDFPAHWPIASVYAGLARNKLFYGNDSLLLSLKQGSPHRSRKIILQFGSDCVMDGVMDPRLSCAGSMASPSRPITAGRRNTDLCVRVNSFRGWSDHPCRYPSG